MSRCSACNIIRRRRPARTIRHYLFDDFMKLMKEQSLVPRRNDLHRILIIGSGPIIIGQACEFDYSGTQAARRCGPMATKSS